MDPYIALVIGGVAGLVIGWAIARRGGAGDPAAEEALNTQLATSLEETRAAREQLARVGAEKDAVQQQLDDWRSRCEQADRVVSDIRESLARAESERDSARELLMQLKEDRNSLKETMQVFSAEQFKENREEFLKHAELRLGMSEEKHTAELEKRQEAFEKEFKGVHEKMQTYEEMHRKIEDQRIKDFGSLNQQLLGLAEQTKEATQQSQKLETVLKGSPQQRGKWGEIALRNIVEMAGMTEHCDFEEQVQTDSDKRPDMVVRLPGDGRIPIDAKTPYDDFDRAMEETDPDLQRGHLEKLAKNIQNTMQDLAKKDYPRVVGGKVDFTVMFIPIESVAAAAFSIIPDLQEKAIEKKILITTPVTLIALLKTVGIYWQQEKLAENAQKIWDETVQLHKRLKTFSNHLAKVGTGLNTAVSGYNNAVASFERRVLPKTRAIEQLTVHESLPELERVETDVRDAATPAVDYNPEQREAEPPGNDSVPEIEETI